MNKKQLKENFSNLNIKTWAEEDRPREKLLLKGREALSDAELIAILIGSGTKSMSAVELGKLILRDYDNHLHKLAQSSVKDLMKFKGMGEAKAITIAAALELGRRRKEQEPVINPKITGSADVYEMMKPHLLDLQVEEVWLLLTNRGMQLIKKLRLSSGGVSGSVVDTKVIFKHALENLASGLILVHNHPSGTLKASNEDIKITNQVKEAGKILEVPLLDHIIFTNNGYLSFADEGMM